MISARSAAHAGSSQARLAARARTPRGVVFIRFRSSHVTGLSRPHQSTPRPTMARAGSTCRPAPPKLALLRVSTYSASQNFVPGPASGMSGERVERRLAAILAADVAGYTPLMGEDEEGTLAALRAIRRELGDPKFTEHRGRILGLDPRTDHRRRSPRRVRQ